MGVHIDQTGRHPEAGGVDAAGIGGNGLARWREYAVDNEQVALLVPAAGRVQDMAIHNEPGAVNMTNVTNQRLSNTRTNISKKQRK